MKRSVAAVFRLLPLAAIVACAVALPVHAAISIVAVEEGPAPGVPGATIAAITDLRAGLNNAGQVAFAANLALGSGGVSTLNDEVIYRYTFGAGSSIVARASGDIPALPGLVYNENGPRYTGVNSINDAGQIVFTAGFGIGGSALFVNGSDIVRGAGTPAPGLPGVNVAGLVTGALDDARINSPVAGRSAEVLHAVQLSGTGVNAANNSALYRSGALVAREGSAAPGTSDLFGAFAGVDNARINGRGQVAFTNNLAGVANAANSVLYRDTPGAGLELIARDGSAAPMAGEAFSAAGFFSPRINVNGQIAYLARLSGGANVLYIDQTLYARDGDPAPGLTGLALSNVGGTPARVELNDQGHPLFVTHVTGPGVTSANDAVLYLAKTPLARTGGASPIDGTSFAAFASGDLALNTHDQLALVAKLAGSAVSAANDYALLFWDGAAWHAIAREGDTLAGSTVAALVGGDGNPRIELNDAGQVLFWANLADGRDGLFLTSAVPEPAAVWSLLAGLLVLGMRMRSRTRRTSTERNLCA